MDQAPPRVGQVWRSPMLNVFDRRIMRVLDGEALYFDSAGRTWGWIGMQDWCSWVRATRATLVEDTNGPMPPEVGKILARNV